MGGGEYDVFKDSPLRYLGYANEVGESFRGVIPVEAVRLSYVVASTYVLADSVDKGYRKWRKLHSAPVGYRCKRTTVATVDTLIWQGLASVIIPGFTINRICWATRLALRRSRGLSPATQSWIAVGVGLCAIPFIIKPIDRGVDFIMDNTLRKLYENP